MLLSLLASILAVGAWVPATLALSSDSAVVVRAVAEDAKNCTTLIPDGGDMTTNPELRDCIVDLIQGDCHQFASSEDPAALPELAGCVVSGAPGLAILTLPDTTTTPLQTRANRQPPNITECVNAIATIVTLNNTSFDIASLKSAQTAGECFLRYISPCTSALGTVAKLRLPSDLYSLEFFQAVHELQSCVQKISQGPVPADGEYCLDATHEYDDRNTIRVYLQYCLKVSNSQADLIMKLSYPQYKDVFWWDASENNPYGWLVDGDAGDLFVRNAGNAFSGITKNVGRVASILSAGSFTVRTRYEQHGPATFNALGGHEMNIPKDCTFDIPAA